MAALGDHGLEDGQCRPLYVVRNSFGFAPAEDPALEHEIALRQPAAAGGVEVSS